MKPLKKVVVENINVTAIDARPLPKAEAILYEQLALRRLKRIAWRDQARRLLRGIRVVFSPLATLEHRTWEENPELYWLWNSLR